MAALDFGVDCARLDAMKLTPQQQEWLDSHVASGEFASVDEAIGALIDERMALEEDDMLWAKPYVDEARESVARGAFITLDEHRTRTARRLAALK